MGGSQLLRYPELKLSGPFLQNPGPVVIQPTHPSNHRAESALDEIGTQSPQILPRGGHLVSQYYIHLLTLSMEDQAIS